MFHYVLNILEELSIILYNNVNNIILNRPDKIVLHLRTVLQHSVLIFKTILDKHYRPESTVSICEAVTHL